MTHRTKTMAASAMHECWRHPGPDQKPSFQASTVIPNSTRDKILVTMGITSTASLISSSVAPRHLAASVPK